MVMLGDVALTVTVLVITGLAAWATLLLLTLLFPSRSAVAAQEMEHHPWRALWLGLAVFGPGALIGLVALNLPSPAAKLLGFVGLLLLLILGFLGATGLVDLMAKRMMDQEGAPNRFAAVSKGAGLLTLAGLLPLVGWFLVAPVVLVAGIGAGVRGVFARSPKAATAAVPPRVTPEGS